jgi:hypothetical protein
MFQTKAEEENGMRFFHSANFSLLFKASGPQYQRKKQGNAIGLFRHVYLS